MLDPFTTKDILMSALFHGEMTSDEDSHTLNSYIVPTMFLTLFHLFCYKWKAQQVELQNNKRAEPLKKKKKKKKLMNSPKAYWKIKYKFGLKHFQI